MQAWMKERSRENGDSRGDGWIVFTSTSCGVGNESKISTLMDSDGGRRGGKDKQWLDRWTRATHHAAA